jgi:hypothetical protein
MAEADGRKRSAGTTRRRTKLTDIEARFMSVVDRSTRGLPEYDRGITSVFALAAFRTGYRAALDERQEPSPVTDETDR